MEHEIHISFRANPLIVVSNPITSLYIWGIFYFDLFIHVLIMNFITDKFVFVGLQNGLLQIFKIKQKVEESSVKLFFNFLLLFTNLFSSILYL